MSFVDDNLLVANGPLLHHGVNLDADEEMSPTLENMIVLTWLRLIHPELPNLVKQRYGTDLRSKTLASLKPEISLALDSLLEEIRTAADSHVLRATAARFRQPSRAPSRPPPKPYSGDKRPKSCPLCKQAKRDDNHFLSSCPFLPREDRNYLTRSRLATCVDDDYAADDFETHDFPDQDDLDPPIPPSARIISRRVSTHQSPQFKAFFRQQPLTLTLDTGAETSMIKSSVAQSIGARIKPTSQKVFQADGISALNVKGETHLTLSRDNLDLSLEALVVDDLDVDVLAGTPFLIANDISVRPAKCQVRIQDSVVIYYQPTAPPNPASHAVRRAQCHVLRSSSPSTVLWPGEFIEVDTPPDLDNDIFLAVEPLPDSLTKEWFAPQIVETVGNKVRLLNTSSEPHRIKRHDHICRARPIIPTENLPPPFPDKPSPTKPHPTLPFSDDVTVDPDNLLSVQSRTKFQQLLREFDGVFDPRISGYNGAAGPIEATVNMGPVQPPQRKGRIPQYSRNQLVELQSKFDELEEAGVFRRPEDIGITVEYLNPSFLIKKPSGGHRLVTAFTEVGRYAKPQPSLMPDVNSTLRTIAPWKFIIKTDLTQAFYQIPLARSSLKYCGVATPFRGVRVYSRSAMGMPGSETALEEVMCRVLGDLIQEGCVAKIADDLYCGADTTEELMSVFKRLLEALNRCNLRLSATKTVICPKTTSILGWIWSAGTLSASPHRIAVLTNCPPPETVKGLRSFIGAYKVLSRVLPHCADVIDPLETSISGLQSHDKLQWEDHLAQKFKAAQQKLATHQSIVLPRSTDTLWIVTDGSVTKRGLGATLYVSRRDQIHLAGFFSAKLRKHQVNWLPCEIEALCIAAAVKHFSPFIIQSVHHANVLTDSKPCVQAVHKLCRGEFSASPRVTSFLSIVSRYQVNLQHLAGKANLPSDFASRNAPDCDNPKCQVCAFIIETEESVVRSVSVQDLLNGSANLPFTTRSAWLSIQNECPDLRRVHAHLRQGTRPSKKLTNIKDVKRYLNVSTISKDGLLVVKRTHPFSPPTDTIVVPRPVLDGLLTALHIKLNHPSRNQLLLVFQRHFYALDSSEAITRVSSACHTCASLMKTPSCTVPQSTEDPPEVVGISFACDVIKRYKQMILVVRECATSFTASCLIKDETHDTLQAALTRLLVGLNPLDGPSAILRVDPAPCFIALANNDSLMRINVCIEVWRVKNKNKNPVAEKAVQELEEELLRQEPCGGPVTETTLALATARLNSRIRHHGLSSRELWTQRSQFDNHQLPISDYHIILAKHEQRSSNHRYSERSKHPAGFSLKTPPLQVGDLVYLYSDKDKNRARDRYIVVHIDGIWCFIKKFSGSQLRATSYKVKLYECYTVPPSLSVSRPLPAPPSTDSDTLSTVSVAPPVLTLPLDSISDHNNPPPPQEIGVPLPLEDVTSDDLLPRTDLSHPISTRDPPFIPNPASFQTPDPPPLARPQRSRRPPKYLSDYVLS